MWWSDSWDPLWSTLWIVCPLLIVGCVWTMMFMKQGRHGARDSNTRRSEYDKQRRTVRA